MNEIILIVGMLIVTYIARYPLLVLVGRISLPDRVFRALRYVPVAVLTAISVPVVLLSDGQINLQASNAYLVGAIVAVIVSWRTKNLLLTIVLGMAVFLFWRLVLFA